MFQISSVGSSDGGNYTCAPDNIHPHSVIVNIMDTEGKYAAVHRDGLSRGAGLAVTMTDFQFWLIILIVCERYE